MFTKLLKEPLLHFLLLGGLLFGVYALVNPGSVQSDKTIVVDAGRIANLAARFKQTWYRDPTPAEMKGLIEDYVMEEIYYREALAMGIDKNDPMIRRRLRQKMEFFSANAASILQASDEQLNQYLQQHPDQFTTDTVYSFRQIYLSPDRPAEQLDELVRHAARSLARGEQVVGDRTLLPDIFEHTTEAEIDRTLGAGFSAKLATLPLNEWSPPLHSGVGIHFIKLSTRQAGKLPGLDQVRDAVQREWTHEKQQQLDQAIKEKLFAKYHIEYPTAGDKS